MSDEEQAPKRHAGRPPLPPGEAKGKMFCLRLNDDERAAIEAAAGAAGKSASEWARELLLAATAPDGENTDPEHNDR